MSNFWAQNQHFSGLVHYLFLIYCMELELNKVVRATEPIFREISIMPKTR